MKCYYYLASLQVHIQPHLKLDFLYSNSLYDEFIHSKYDKMFHMIDNIFTKQN